MSKATEEEITSLEHAFKELSGHELSTFEEVAFELRKMKISRRFSPEAVSRVDCLTELLSLDVENPWASDDDRSKSESVRLSIERATLESLLSSESVQRFRDVYAYLLFLSRPPMDLDGRANWYRSFLLFGGFVDHSRNQKCDRDGLRLRAEWRRLSLMRHIAKVFGDRNLQECLASLCRRYLENESVAKRSEIPIRVLALLKEMDQRVTREDLFNRASVFLRVCEEELVAPAFDLLLASEQYKMYADCAFKYAEAESLRKTMRKEVVEKILTCADRLEKERHPAAKSRAQTLLRSAIITAKHSGDRDLQERLQSEIDRLARFQASTLVPVSVELDLSELAARIESDLSSASIGTCLGTIIRLGAELSARELESDIARSPSFLDFVPRLELREKGQLLSDSPSTADSEWVKNRR